MLTRLLTLLLLLGATNASAQLCTPGEYAQYKDRAATEEGLLRLAVDYCMYFRIAKADLEYQRGMAAAGSRVSPRQSDACLSAISKISDAVTAAGKADQWRAMTTDPRGCDASLAKLTKPNSPTTATTAVPAGGSKHTIDAERLVKANGCQSPAASMTAKTPGTEIFNVSCSDGQLIIVRCDYDDCRLLTGVRP